MASCECTITLKNEQTETDRLCDRLLEFGQALGLSKKTTHAINLAIEELFTNIVSYGYADGGDHDISVSIRQEGQQLVIRMEDDGDPFDPATAETPDLKCSLEESKIGGLGIHLAKKLMDDFQYERRGKQNVITMKKNLPET